MNVLPDYYSMLLSANRLKRVYEIAPFRIREYLEAEIEHVLRHIHPGDHVLELGCGYGRVLPFLAKKAGFVAGIDTSFSSLQLGLQLFPGLPGLQFLQMNAIRLAFGSRVFDCIICIQNGISAFHVDQRTLMEESFRVAKPGGIILFSSYAERFWEDRLAWFRLQAQYGLVGPIDELQTRDGVIACRDGFTSTTVTPEQFRLLTHGLDVQTHIVEVDGSSLFCEMTRKGE